jgi:hypothetical protein
MKAYSGDVQILLEYFKADHNAMLLAGDGKSNWGPLVEMDTPKIKAIKHLLGVYLLACDEMIKTRENIEEMTGGESWKQ